MVTRKLSKVDFDRIVKVYPHWMKSNARNFKRRGAYIKAEYPIMVILLSLLASVK